MKRPGFSSVFAFFIGLALMFTVGVAARKWWLRDTAPRPANAIQEPANSEIQNRGQVQATRRSSDEIKREISGVKAQIDRLLPYEQDLQGQRADLLRATRIPLAGETVESRDGRVSSAWRHIDTLDYTLSSLDGMLRRLRQRLNRLEAELLQELGREPEPESP